LPCSHTIRESPPESTIALVAICFLGSIAIACAKAPPGNAAEPKLAAAQATAVTTVAHTEDTPDNTATDSKDEPRTPRPEPFVELPVPDLEPSVVSFPPSAPFPQPVLISAHGAGDSAREMCEFWRAVLGDRGIVLCPAGPRMRAHEEGRYYPDHHALERITFAAVRALAERYPREADMRRIVYTGYSQGATMGALMIPEHGAECPRLILVEGGFDDWTTARALTFKKAGGNRVLFACGRQACKTGADRSAAWLKSVGVLARVVTRVGAGHTIGVIDAAMPEFDWLVEGDSRWTPNAGLPPTNTGSR
jgi:predicted esterase